MSTESTTEVHGEGGKASGPATFSVSPRYYALDCVRAMAMLLGVVYHTLMFRMFMGGGPPGPMGGMDPSRLLGDWLHCFRMPLFFLISGFFARMMLAKYGIRGYLVRRWWRIGIPLLVGMFTFCPLYIIARDVTSQQGRGGPGPMGPPGAGGPRGGPPSVEGMPRPPRGFMPTPLRSFDKNDDGELSDAEWQEVTKRFNGPSGRGPGGGPGGFRPGGPMPGPFGGQGNALADRLFGPLSRYFQLHHLWFLWYLLIFATVAPWVTKGFSFFLLRPTPEAADRFIQRVFRSGIAPVLLAAAATPALLLTSSPFGWFLGLAPTIFRGFPDILLHFDPDMVFYFVYFLAGWLLHREREVLPSLSRAWLPDLLLGLVAFAAATALSGAYNGQTDAPYYGLIRTGAYALYCLASASASFAFLGVFLRYLDQPSRVWRYLADTALWVYLIHQPLVLLGLALVKPLQLPWWALAVVVSTLSTGAALVLYELIVRPTPLVRLFGPSSARKPAANVVLQES